MAIPVLRINDANAHQLHDNTVVKRVLSGEKELFEILLRRYNQKLFRVVRSYLKDDEDIEDVMQDTYLKAFDKLWQFKGDASFSTWLIRIGINEALLRLRAMKKHRNLYAGENDIMRERIIQLPDSKQMNPEKMAIRNEAEKILERAVDALPEKYRIIYVLKEIEGMENAAIAECLGITDTNVKVRLHRAKTLLKDALYKLSADAAIFEFGNSRCDKLVAKVMNSI